MRPLETKMVGATGFEPAISHSQSERDTKLRHAPIILAVLSSLYDRPYGSSGKEECNALFLFLSAAMTSL
jgi:hypothetical protein